MANAGKSVSVTTTAAAVTVDPPIEALEITNIGATDIEINVVAVNGDAVSFRVVRPGENKIFRARTWAGKEIKTFTHKTASGTSTLNWGAETGVK